MPLRDHFRPPISKRSSWEGFHGMWPAAIIQQLRKQLPPGYVAEPRVRLGTYFEIDVSAFESDDVSEFGTSNGNGVATATATATATLPIVTVESDLPTEYEYEVLVFDVREDRQLVAAIEIVSPGNKDRPLNRDAFVSKCAALLRKGVAVSIVDLVTVRNFNLYAELMALIDQPRLAPIATAPNVYAASCRWVERGKKNYLDTWSQALVVGQPLPTIPLWLAENLMLGLDLEPTYEQACHDLWIS